MAEAKPFEACGGMMSMRKGLIAILLVLVLASACIGQAKANPYQLTFGGAMLTFRANLEQAAKTPVDDANSVRALLLDPNIEEVHLAYIPNQSAAPRGGTITGFYLVDGYELAYKLTAIYSTYFGGAVNIITLPLNSTGEALAAATKERPVIIMEAGRNPTEVRIDGNYSIVYVRGADMSQNGRDYTDLDLAVDKLLLVLMGRD
jgi:hypothetical protein